jgi:biopolymer transport protein ExbD
MAMQTTGSNTSGEPMMDINMTPLIDVMLVLLIMFIITIPIQTHAVKLDMPAPNPNPPTVIPETVELQVDFDGTVLWNGTPVDRATMNAYFADASKKDPQPEIHVSPNRLAKYDAVARVLADAQRQGATHIGFTGIDQYN